MNAEKLLAYVDSLLHDEDFFLIQEALDELNSSLANLAVRPQDTDYQTEVSDGLIKLDERLKALVSSYDAVKLRGIISIGAEPYFTQKLINGIRESISENSMTPTIVHEFVANLTRERSAYVSNLDNVKTSLAMLSIVPDRIEEGSAEIGFQLPRSLFNNELDGLVKELRAIRRIINAFSEGVSGSAEPIEVRNISTTDPIFYFGISAVVISQIGGAVTWALEQWKQIESIRKVRAEAKNLKVYNSADIRKFFDEKIKETVAAAVEAKTAEIIGPTDGLQGRKLEQRTDMMWALDSILARVERGMIVEIKFIAPPAVEEENQTETTRRQAEVFSNLETISQKLSFPPVEPHPVLSLPALPAKEITPEAKAPAPRPRSRRAKRGDAPS